MRTDNLPHPVSHNRMAGGYRALLSVLLVIGLTLLQVIALFWSLIYFINFEGRDPAGRDTQISQNSSIYYQGVLGKLRLVREGPRTPGQDQTYGWDE